MTIPSSATPGNPYVGPRTFTREQAHLFFGREQEARDLLARVVSERLLLFYAQSGAGKSSLINTRLIPDLQEEGFAVLPVARVSGELPTGARPTDADNVFLLNLMLSLAPETFGPADWAKVTLSQFLARLTTEDGERWRYDPSAALPAPAAAQPCVLIVDQFEELITTHGEHWQQREGFFRQLNQALLEDPNLWVVLTLREDYVAALDPFAALTYNRLCGRFYMERMGVEAALEAVRRPAELGGRPFAAGVAEQLVDNLRQVRVPGQAVTVPGPYVEPVQLQVVCYQLWANLTARDGAAGRGQVITADDLQAAGDVNQALTAFYEAALTRALGPAGLSERVLRRWVDTTLITPAHTRALVYRGPTDTSGLTNPAADELNRSFLIRPVVRGGDTWYELAHDRLVEPILEANRAWQVTHQNPLSDPTAAWLAVDRAPTALLDGRQLRAAQAFAAAHPDELTGEEKAFLEESRRAWQATRRRRTTALAAVIALIVLGLLAAWAWWNRAQAQQQAQVARSRRLAAAAMSALDVDPELSSLLSIQGLAAARTQEAEQALHASLQTTRLEHNLSGHEGPVYDAAISPDGRLIATGGADGTVRLWDTQTGQTLFTLTGATGAVWGVAFSPDGRRLAGASRDGTVRLWNTATGEELATLAGHLGGVLDVAFSPDGSLLATGGEDETVRLWQLTDDAASSAVAGHPVSTIAPQRGLVWGVAFSPDGATLATASGSLTPELTPGAVQLWDVASQQELLTLEGHTDTVEAVVWSPDGQRLATGSWDETARVWDALTGQQLLVLPGHTNWVRGVSFSPDGSRIATSSYDRRAKVWEVSSGRELFTLAGHQGWLKGIAFSPDGRRLVTAGEEGMAKVWNAGPTAELLTIDGHSGEEVNAIAFNPITGAVATAGEDGQAQVWDGASGELLFTLPHAAAVTDVEFSADGALIATASQDRTARLWSATTGEPLPLVAEHRVPVTAVALSPDNRRLATATPDSVARVWDVASGQVVTTLTGHSGRVNSVAFSPDGAQIATAAGDRSVRLWDASTGQELRRLDGHTDEVYDVTFDRTGQRLATAGVDQTARVWDATTGQLLLTLGGHGDRVTGVAFSPDGTKLATSSWDQSTRLWQLTPGASGDAAAGSTLLILTGHDGKVLDVTFDPSGERLVTAGQDGTARLYALTVERVIGLAKDRLHRRWTPEDCRVYLPSEPCAEQ